jgi:hypothetical protein
VWLRTLITTLVAITLVVVATFGYGSFRWSRETASFRARLDATKLPLAVRAYDDKETTNLPAPVQRYFRVALKPGQDIMTAAAIEHRGDFNMSATEEKWTPFTSNQRVITHRSGFAWGA